LHLKSFWGTSVDTSDIQKEAVNWASKRGLSSSFFFFLPFSSLDHFPFSLEIQTWGVLFGQSKGISGVFFLSFNLGGSRT
jgi:hypothetical protein